VPTYYWFDPTIDGMESLPPSLLELDAYLLSKIGKDARRRAAIRLAERELRLWHLAVLAALADFGPLVQRELAARLGLDPSDVVKVLDELTTRGQVERTRDPADRRRVQARLTPDGHAALAVLLAEARTTDEELLAPLDPAEREQLHGLLTRVLDHARAESPGAV
jgi:MarR family transcriptional regulator, lower aerobic nicotinate degradation pathway regulator